MIPVTLKDQPPLSSEVTEYDEQNLGTYIRLLDADVEGADWREAVVVIFGINPDLEPDRARLVHTTHLARARWMTEFGYRHLLEPPASS